MEEKIWAYLTGCGLTAAETAAIMGSLAMESGLNPVNLQNSYNKKLNISDEDYCSAVDNGTYRNFAIDGAGWGLAQWTFSSRKQGLWDAAVAAGRSIGDMEVQLDFLIKELTTGYSEVLEGLYNAQSIGEACDIFTKGFERPADQSETALAKRRQKAAEIYARNAENCGNPQKSETEGVTLGELEIVTRYTTKNPSYRNGRTITVRGLMLHSVGCGQENPEVFANSFDSANQTVSVHGFVGAEKAIITLPCMETPGTAARAVHAGKVNGSYIGVEMCEPNSVQYGGGSTFTYSGSTFTCYDYSGARSFVEKTTKNAARLFAMLCRFHGLNPLEDGVILSHYEGNLRGIATAHADPDHLWQQLGMDWTMDRFRETVAEYMREEEDENMDKTAILERLGDEYIESYNDLPEWAKPDIRELLDRQIINGGTDYATNPDDINMYLSDIKTMIVCKRMIEQS